MRNFLVNRDNLLSLGLTGKIFAKRPSELLEIRDHSQLAIDIDLAAAKEVLRWENKRALKRLEALIKSLGVMFTGLLGGDAKALIEKIRAEAEAEEAGENEIDPDDDPNVL